MMALRALVLQLGQPLACLDLETTGGHTERDQITEIGIVQIQMDGTIEHWSSLINPERRIPARISALTGISDAMVADAPTFQTLAPEILARLQHVICVAHNARFDMGFLKQAFRRLGMSFNPRVLCSVKLSRWLFPEARSHSLDRVIARHGLTCTARHRALGDAEVVANFLELMAADRLEDLVASCQMQWKVPSLPPNLSADVLDDMPDRPGVYLIFGEGELPLYIGKSIHLRQRVLDHFRNDHRQQKEMRLAQQAQRIEWIETPGELSALLLESKLIKEKSPTLNRALRRTRELCTLRWVLGENRPPQILCGDVITPGETYGAFRSPHEANQILRDMSAAHGLCDIRLGLQKGAGPCFAHQIKRCKGACVGLESPLKHDLRLATALQKLRIAHWPYRGPIAVHEPNLAGGGDVLHVIDQWVHLGSIQTQDELDAILESPRPSFDLDVYRILLRHLPKYPVTVLALSKA